MTLYALFTQDGLDHVCSTKTEAKAEARDLKNMGCIVTILESVDGTEYAFYQIDDLMRDGLSYGAARRKALGH